MNRHFFYSNNEKIGGIFLLVIQKAVLLQHNPIAFSLSPKFDNQRSHYHILIFNQKTYS